jgi:hypothetical protein
MFWNRVRREARRQKVLDELLELDPNDRRARLEAAVAAGDVRADEVDSALQMVHRLDNLRGMTLPTQGLQRGLPGSPRFALKPVEEETASAELIVVAEPTRLEPVITDGVAEPEADPSWVSADSKPIDAVEAASRLLARHDAARKSRRSSRSRRLHALVSVDIAERHGDALRAGETATDSRPDISWLRP